MNTHAKKSQRSVGLTLAVALLAAVAFLPGDTAEAAPNPTDLQIDLIADPITGNCVATVDWNGGKGQLYVNIVLFRKMIDATGNEVLILQSAHGQKVSAAGDARGSSSMAHEFSSPSGDHLIDVTVKRAKGRGGTAGEVITWDSWIGTGQTTTCGF